MKHILVTGATGFIGYEVARRLAEQGYRPRCLVRRPLRGGLLAGGDAELMQGDLTSPESLRRAVRGMDTVLHLGARATFEDYGRLRPTIVEGSVELMKAALAAGVKTFVYSSSLLVYSSQDRPIDAATPAGTRLGYGRAKLETEAALQQMAAGSDLALSMVRLPHVYGARDLIFEQIRRGKAIYPGPGHNLFAHLHIADAARLLIRIAETRWSGVSAVADQRPATWVEFFAVVKEYLPHLRLVKLPRWLALLGTALLNVTPRRGDRPFLYTPDAVRSANMRLPVQAGLIWDDIGIQPDFPTIHEGIPAVLDDCVAFRWIHPVNDRR
ncbi:MAG: NAD(P)-dependent oxidoreductase [Acidobacteria bacterium]|nr:NAD(P)-dependent oxidoreductase [Acidobacteriota bacterium]